MLRFRLYEYKLQFRHPFRLSNGVRTHTDVVFLELEWQGKKGYGEAALPPYLPETFDTVKAFLRQIEEQEWDMEENFLELVRKADKLAPGNNAAKACFDIALHDLVGKIKGMSICQMYNLSPEHAPLCTFTIAIGSAREVAERISESQGFSILKFKLGSKYDEEVIKMIPAETDKSFCVDINQGWNDLGYATEMMHFLKEQGALLVEQPVHKANLQAAKELKQRNILPVVADEALQRLPDMVKIADAYDGVNVKLMKSTGLNEAYYILLKARELKMLTLIGCMSESSCGVTAAAHLSPLCDYADLDGPWLIKNDPFKGIAVQEGKIIVPDGHGSGAMKVKDL